MIQNPNTDLQTILVTAGLRIAGGIAILLIGRWLAGLLQRSVKVLLKRTRATPALIQIITRFVYYGILLLAIYAALVVLGIRADLLLAALGILVVVAAVALRESLRDLAATIIFVVFQPFKVGDLIETNGIVGQVQEILLFNTMLITTDNRQIFIPNGNIQNSTMVNLSALQERRLDLPVHLSYADDIRTTKDALLEIANADARVLQTPAPVVHVMELGASQVEYVLRVYANPADFWDLQSALNERIKLLLEQRQLTPPLPQLQLHSGKSLSQGQAEQHREDGLG